VFSNSELQNRSLITPHTHQTSHLLLDYSMQSVFSFLSETDEDYINVVPSPPVVPVEGYTLPKSHTFVEEVPIVRCRNLNHPTYAFTVAVGKKPSHATQYVDDAIDVADLLVKIAKGSAQSRRWSRANTEENMFT